MISIPVISLHDYRTKGLSVSIAKQLRTLARIMDFLLLSSMEVNGPAIMHSNKPENFLRYPKPRKKKCREGRKIRSVILTGN